MTTRTQQFIVHGRATGYAGLHAAAKPKAGSEQQPRKGAVMVPVTLDDGTTAVVNLTELVGKAVSDAVAAALDDAAGKRPATHAAGRPLLAYRSEPARSEDDQGDPSGHGKPLLPYGRPRKAS